MGRMPYFTKALGPSRPNRMYCGRDGINGEFFVEARAPSEEDPNCGSDPVSISTAWRRSFC